MKKLWRAPGVLAAILLFGAGLAPAAGAADLSTGTDWPQFRGPQQNGVSVEKGLLRSWPESGPKLLWKKPIGSGFSTVTVVGDALYTMAVEGESETAYRLRESDGEVVCRVPLGNSRALSSMRPPRGTRWSSSERTRSTASPPSSSR